MTKEEIRDVVDWEGGAAEAIIGYGLHYRALPEDAPKPVVAAWAWLYNTGREHIRTVEDWLEGSAE